MDYFEIKYIEINNPYLILKQNFWSLQIPIELFNIIMDASLAIEIQISFFLHARTVYNKMILRRPPPMVCFCRTAYSLSMITQLHVWSMLLPFA